MLIDIIIDLLVSVLLVLTIGYAAMLNKRLVKLRQDEQKMREELFHSSELASKILHELKSVIANGDKVLCERLNDAEEVRSALKADIQRGETLLGHIGQTGPSVNVSIADAKGKSPQAAEPMNVARGSRVGNKSIAALRAAAEYFQERKAS